MPTDIPLLKLNLQRLQDVVVEVASASVVEFIVPATFQVSNDFSGGHTDTDSFKRSS